MILRRPIFWRLVDTLQIWYVDALSVRGGRAMIESICLEIPGPRV